MYAKSIGAIFQKTSAVSGIGVYELFQKIGGKILDPNYKDIIDIDDENKEEKNEKPAENKVDDNKGSEIGKNNNNDADNKVKQIEDPKLEDKKDDFDGFECFRNDSLKLDKKKIKTKKKKRKCCG